MKRMTALFALSIFLAAPASGSCPVTERDLIGGWRQSGNAGFFEEFALGIEAGTHVFDSWLHERPDLSDARWKLENCQLIIEPQAQDAELGIFRFKVLGLGKDRLRLYSVSEHMESVYVRLPDTP